MTDMLNIKDLTHGFRNGTSSRIVLDQVNLSLRAGETNVIVGKSGCGKSTLLNILGLLLTPHSGEIILNGQNILELSKSEKARFRLTSTGFIFQNFNLINELSVEENISLPLLLQGKQTLEVRAKVSEILNRIDGAAFRNTVISDLSGGERQRVAIARAVIHQPRLILADEPTGNLDTKTGQLVLAVLNSLVQSVGCAMLLVTHNLELAAQYSQVWQLTEGKLERID